MFKFFRFILILFSLASGLLSLFAIVGSSADKSYLTKDYLIDFELTKLDLSKVFDVDEFKRVKRAPTPTEDVDKRSTWWPYDSDGSSTASTTSSTSSSASTSDTQAVVSQIVSQYSYSDLGLADVYSVSLWGYCRGELNEDSSYDDDLNEYTKEFNNNKVNITYCSKPKFGYKFDPLTVLKHELNNTINGVSDGDSSTTDVSDSVKSELQVLLDNVSYDNLNVPSESQKSIQLNGKLSQAAAGLLMAGCVLSFVSVAIQVLGCFCSPDSCCLSFLNFLFQSVIFIILLVGSAIMTGVYMALRKNINDNTDSYGIKSYLSTEFYAFAWSSVVAALLVCNFCLLGHCCGLFNTGRKKFQSMAHGAKEDIESEMGYDHKEHDSDSD